MTTDELLSIVSRGFCPKLKDLIPVSFLIFKLILCYFRYCVGGTSCCQIFGKYVVGCQNFSVKCLVSFRKHFADVMKTFLFVQKYLEK